MTETAKRERVLPPWLRRRISSSGTAREVSGLIRDLHLETVCASAHCPNIYECFSRGTATFMILGAVCTRNCRFCSVGHGPKAPPESDEPKRVAQAVKCMNLSYVVVTSVTRDDLEDGGAGFFAMTIEEIRKIQPRALIEVLIPDFQGNANALKTVMTARPDVLNHNLETAKEYFDMLVLLNMRLVAFGPTQEVFTPQLLSKTYGGKLTILTDVSEAIASAETGRKPQTSLR